MTDSIAASGADSDALLRASMIDVDLSLLVMLGLFFIFWFMLSKLVTNPLLASQKKRRDGLEDANRAASNAELELARARNAYERKLSEARAEGVATRERAKAEATEEANAMITAKRAEAEAANTAAMDEVAGQLAAARQEIAPHAEQLADQLVTRLLATAGSATSGGKS